MYLLPWLSVLTLDQVSTLDGFLEDRGQLRNVRIDYVKLVSNDFMPLNRNMQALTPYANLHTVLSFDLSKVRLRIREVVGIKSERAPKQKRVHERSELHVANLQTLTTRIASSRNSPGGRLGQGSCGLAYPARIQPPSLHRKKSGTMWITTSRTSTPGANYPFTSSQIFHRTRSSSPLTQDDP